MTRARWFALARAFGLAAGLGVAVGFAWFLIAPRPRFEVVEGGLVFASDFPGEFVAMDGWFAVLALVAGVVTAAVMLWSARERRIGVVGVVATAATSLLGSLLAWRVGLLLAPRRDALDGTDAVGTIIRGPLELHAIGVLVVWPVVALCIVLFVLAWQGPLEQNGGEDLDAGSPTSADAGDGSVGTDRRPGDLDAG